MRSTGFLIAATLLALASPAAAQDVVFVSGTGAQILAPFSDSDDAATEFGDDGISNIADRMDDPLIQDGISNTVERMAGAMMNMRVGPLAEAIERARPGTVKRRIRRDSTVGDLAGRDADYMPERLGDKSREVMGMMGGFARAMASMMPEFERLGREMEDSVNSAKNDARRRD